MISRIKLMIYRIFRRPIAESRLDFFKKNGNLKFGDNCDIDSLSIQSYFTKPDFVNVEIGSNCYLLGTIVLHSDKSKVKIGNRVFIGPNTTIFCYDEVEIEDDVMISWGCTLIDTNAHSLRSDERKNDVLDWKKGWEYKNWGVVESKKILIEEKCWIGFNSIIMKGIVLSKGTIVASGSVVTKNTEAFDIIGGNPASFIKKTT